MADGIIIGDLPNGGVLTPSGQSTLSQLNKLNSFNLAQGMTAGYGYQDGNYANPPYNWSHNAYGGFPEWQPARQGLMRNIASAGAQQYNMFFLYNPNNISVSFKVNPNIMPGVITYGQQSPGNQNGVQNQTANLVTGQVVEWKLTFDRTYDMMYGSNPSANRGVLKDVAALYNILGTFQDSGTPTSSPIEVIFGQNNYNSGSAGSDTSVSANSGAVWGFTGFITDISVEYGIFKYNMMPSRCDIDLTMQCIYVAATPSQTPPTSSTANASSPPVSVNSNAFAFTGPFGIG